MIKNDINVGSDGWGKVPIDEADYLAWLAANRETVRSWKFRI